MDKLNTVFWDLDGTLADTEMSVHRKAFNLAFSDYRLGCYWSKKDYLNLLDVGGGKQRIYSFFKDIDKQIKPSLINDLHRRKQYHYNILLEKSQNLLRIGVLNLVYELYSLKINQFIVTTSCKSSVNVFLKKFFSTPFNPFNGVIAGDDVKCRKPDPEAYLLALELSQSNPLNSIVIEDSLIGLRSAKAAGIKCLITLSPWLSSISSEMLKADLIVDHLGDSNRPIEILHGFTRETIVNYECLSTLLEE